MVFTARHLKDALFVFGGGLRQAARDNPPSVFKSRYPAFSFSGLKPRRMLSTAPQFSRSPPQAPPRYRARLKRPSGSLVLVPSTRAGAHVE